MAQRNWIAGAIGKPGALHANLGIPQGQTIPQATLQSAVQRPGVVGREARLAETLKGMRPKKKSPIARAASGGGY